MSNADSHVISALHPEPQYLRSAVRFSLGRFTTEAEIDIVIRKVVRSVNELRALA